MRLIDADALIKNDEVTEWLSINPIRTGKMLKAFSELFIKKVNEMSTINAIPIPEDATNRDVIKAVFPNVKIIVSETGEIAHIHENALIKDNFMFVQVSTKWLNTPYKAESEKV